MINKLKGRNILDEITLEVRTPFRIGAGLKKTKHWGKGTKMIYMGQTFYVNGKHYARFQDPDGVLCWMRYNEAKLSAGTYTLKKGFSVPIDKENSAKLKAGVRVKVSQTAPGGDNAYMGYWIKVLDGDNAGLDTLGAIGLEKAVQT